MTKTRNAADTDRVSMDRLARLKFKLQLSGSRHGGTRRQFAGYLRTLRAYRNAVASTEAKREDAQREAK